MRRWSPTEPDLTANRDARPGVDFRGPTPGPGKASTTVATYRRHTVPKLRRAGAAPFPERMGAPIVAVMDSIEILKDLADRPRKAAEALRAKLTPDLLNAHPHHDNSIAWLLWHAARELDVQIAGLSGEEAVWTAQGFDGRFGLGIEPTNVGYGHSPRQARAIRVKDPDLLLEHLGAVISRQRAYLDTLDEAALSEIIDDQWDPPVTRGARLVSISADALEHVGQAAYITGMASAAFE